MTKGNPVADEIYEIGTERRIKRGIILHLNRSAPKRGQGFCGVIAAGNVGKHTASPQSSDC